MTRDDAYRVVQRNAQRAWDEQRSFRELLEADAEVTEPARRRSGSTSCSTTGASCATRPRSSTRLAAPLDWR